MPPRLDDALFAPLGGDHVTAAAGVGRVAGKRHAIGALVEERAVDQDPHRRACLGDLEEAALFVRPERPQARPDFPQG